MVNACSKHISQNKGSIKDTRSVTFTPDILQKYLETFAYIFQRGCVIKKRIMNNVKRTKTYMLCTCKY